MIPCPHCNRHVHAAPNGAAFVCPLCGEDVDPSAPSAQKKWVMVGVGVGIVVAIAAGAYLLTPDEEPEKFYQAMYGAVESDITF